MPAKMTKEYFITRGCEIYNGRYSYENIEFVDAKTKVRIICPVHGEFLQTPTQHLRGGGCPLCSYDKAKTSRTSNFDYFVEKARLVHGDKYDYSKFVYKRAKDKGIIICPEHGEFMQSPDLHLRGSGCPHCKGELRKENMEMDKFTFFVKVEEKYGEMFDLSNVNYVNYKTPVKIICREHGSFMIAPHLFVRGQNCPECGKKRQGQTFQKTQEEFLYKAREIHGDRYDYSLVDYKNTNKKIKIICHEKDPVTGKEHGVFLQKPNCHIQGQGCPKCNGNNPLTDEEFAMRGRNVHGDKYDYSESHYVNSHTPLKIICPIHGEFWQMPYKHINEKHGCPECGGKKIKKNIANV